MRYDDRVKFLIGGEELPGEYPATLSWVDTISNLAAGGGEFPSLARLKITTPPDSPLGEMRVQAGDRIIWDNKNWQIDGIPRMSTFRGRKHHLSADLSTLDV